MRHPIHRRERLPGAYPYAVYEAELDPSIASPMLDEGRTEVPCRQRSLDSDSQLAVFAAAVRPQPAECAIGLFEESLRRPQKFTADRRRLRSAGGAIEKLRLDQML
jgi:hypothetical protein